MKALLKIGVAAVAFTAMLASTGCAVNPIPPEGTRVTSKSEAFRINLGDRCQRFGGCTCFLDGVQTTCALVFACLDAGFCERARN